MQACAFASKIFLKSFRARPRSVCTSSQGGNRRSRRSTAVHGNPLQMLPITVHLLPPFRSAPTKFVALLAPRMATTVTSSKKHGNGTCPQTRIFPLTLVAQALVRIRSRHQAPPRRLRGVSNRNTATNAMKWAQVSLLKAQQPNLMLRFGNHRSPITTGFVALLRIGRGVQGAWSSAPDEDFPTNPCGTGVSENSLGRTPPCDVQATLAPVVRRQDCHRELHIA